MNIINPDIAAYARAHTDPHSADAERIHSWTEENSDEARMLSGPVQAAVLQMLIRACSARRVVEVGMFTGYSALAMAEALPDDGELFALDIEAEREVIARSFFDRSMHGSKISIIIGPALETISCLTGSFDFAYLDADKANYRNYYELLLPLLRSGGIIVADNVLWSSEVLNPRDEDAIALDAFNKRVQADDRVTNVLLTVRDGLMVARKR